MNNQRKKRGSKQKGVYKVTSGFYKGKYCTDVSVNGKRIRKYFDTQTEAKNEYYRLHVEQDVESCLNDKITFDEFYQQDFLPHVKKNLAEGTYENYRLKYQTHVKKYIGHMRLAEIRRSDCQNVLNNLTSKKKSCYEAVQTTMSSAFSFAIANQMIELNPASRLDFPTNLEKVTSKNIRCLSIEEQKQFVEIAKKHKHYEQYMLLLATGLRIGELVGLTWSECNLDFENPSIYVVQQMDYKSKTKTWNCKPPKRYIEREIPLDEESRQLLLSVKERSKDIPITDENKAFRDVVFRDKQGMPIQRRVYGEQLRRIAKKHNIEHFHPHTLRHTFATRCIEAGINIKALSEVLGHATVNFTYNRYVHAKPDFVRNEMMKRTNYISNQKTA